MILASLRALAARYQNRLLYVIIRDPPMPEAQCNLEVRLNIEAGKAVLQ